MAKLGLIQWSHYGNELRVSQKIYIGFKMEKILHQIYLTKTSWRSYVGDNAVDLFLSSFNGARCLQSLAEIEERMKVYPFTETTIDGFQAVLRRLQWLIGTNFGVINKR